jgi:ANTAR domain/GAF domain
MQRPHPEARVWLRPPLAVTGPAKGPYLETARSLLPERWKMLMSPDQRLADTFVELADTLVDEFDVVDFLEVLTARCVELLDVTSAGILLAGGRAGTLTAMAASDERARLLGLLEVQAGEGPCFDCCQDGTAVASVALDSAGGRWPRFAPQAVAIGVQSADALPLRLRREVIGSLNLFHASADGLDDAGRRIAQALADAATIGILQQRTLRHAETLAVQLQGALNSRVMIEQAKGVLAERLKVSPDDAFSILRSAARKRNRLLSDLAGDIVAGSADAAQLLR